MNGLTRRIKNIEEKAGLNDKKSYTLIHICRPEGFLSNEELKGKGVYEKGDFRGTVVIIEKCGEENRWIDVSSEEGQKILRGFGYRRIS